MKPLESNGNIKESLQDLFVVLKTSVIFNVLQDTAHWLNNWGNIFSTVSYTLSFILFIEVLYSNVDLVAGYSRDQMLLFFFMGQIAFYLEWALSLSSIDKFIADVRSGNLDLILTKPLPALLYISTKRIGLVSVIRDGLPNIFLNIFIINWAKLNLDPWLLMVGFVILVLGVACTHVALFLSVLPAFWFGEISQVMWLTWDVGSLLGSRLPFEAFNKNLRLIGITIFPAMIQSSLSTSVILGKSDWVVMLLLTALVTFWASVIKVIAWNFAIRHYTSASS